MNNCRMKLNIEKEIVETYKKSNEAIKYFKQLLKSPRASNDTLGLGYTSIEQGESSKSAEERSNKGKNTKPTCHLCGKKGHLMYAGARTIINMISLRMQATITSARSKDIKQMNARIGLSERHDLRVTTTITRSMDIELLSVDQSLCGHLISLQGETTMHITTIGTKIQGKVVTTIRNMVMYLRIA